MSFAGFCLTFKLVHSISLLHFQVLFSDERLKAGGQKTMWMIVTLDAYDTESIGCDVIVLDAQSVWFHTVWHKAENFLFSELSLSINGRPFIYFFSLASSHTDFSHTSKPLASYNAENWSGCTSCAMETLCPNVV